jgi:hypothetical protein
MDPESITILSRFRRCSAKLFLQFAKFTLSTANLYSLYHNRFDVEFIAYSKVTKKLNSGFGFLSIKM